MTTIINTWTIGGVLTLFWGLLMVIFPPNFSNNFFGIKTKWTTKNLNTWIYGQKVFSFILILLGLLFTITSLTVIGANTTTFISVLFLVFSWQVSKFVGHKIIAGKFPELN
ncbi:hypothetical protein EZJ43_15130 [Pedobacter changchengzhani]|uniref:SdpI family protein n=1 Tax=Pedobacter changchengzhani TaxID=2529274 RepID=A0A4R5MHM4_9SPHI|nr:SdpI family protein [Pedobacter changchengzhani]TDG35057.1 hypothetical protein EZJ43_15130 [Pedobacter changchengzhani]